MYRTILPFLLLVSFSFSAPASPYSFLPDDPDKVSAESNLKSTAFHHFLEQTYSGAGLQRAGLNFEVFKHAMIGYYNLQKSQGLSPAKQILSVIDFTKSSKDKRLWIIDLKAKKVLYNSHVAHGRNTGDEFANKFSNAPNSFMSSAGFYVTRGTYFGKHGLSLRIDGVDPGFNTNAMARAVVIHGANYVSEAFIKQTGRLGRSLGCPALPMELSKEIINTIAGNTALYIHTSLKEYRSNHLNPTTAMERFFLQS
ncbi:hypothetical protein BH24BAC1_BH24BAC1_01740 [soil metagenome]